MTGQSRAAFERFLFWESCGFVIGFSLSLPGPSVLRWALKKGITLARRIPVKKHKSKRVKKVKYLNDVKNRLSDDVLPYLLTIKSVYQKTGKGVGFWALTRMIFPVIESVSDTIYRDRSSLKKRAKLLRNLGIEYPFLTWEMFRNTLMHNDEMTVAYYRGKKITWSLSIGQGHKWEKGVLQIDYFFNK